MWLALCALAACAASAEDGAATTTTALFRAAETDVLFYRNSRDPQGQGNASHLRGALATFQELREHADYAALPEQTRVLVIDSCEFCHRTLGEFEEALRYAKALADTPLCQRDSEGCFASVVSRIVLRLRSLGQPQEATDYYNTAMATQTDAGEPLLRWVSEWQMPAWYIPELQAQPFWEDPESASETAAMREAREVLAAHFMDLQGEAIRLATLSSRMERDGVGQLFELQTDFEIVEEGQWTEFLLYDDGEWFDHRCELVPTICQVMSSLAAVAGTVEGFEAAAPGQVTILRMAGGTRLRPHCGPHPPPDPPVIPPPSPGRCPDAPALATALQARGTLG